MWSPGATPPERLHVPPSRRSAGQRHNLQVHVVQRFHGCASECVPSRAARSTTRQAGDEQLLVDTNRSIVLPDEVHRR